MRYLIGVVCLLVAGLLYVNNSAVFSKSKNELPDDIDPRMKKIKEWELNNLDAPRVMNATFPFMTETEVIDQADLIVLGKVKEKKEDYFEQVDIPFSDYSFEVTDYLKAPDPHTDKEELIVTQDGNATIEIQNYPLLKKGEQYLLFLEITSDNKLVMVGGPNGKYKVVGNEARLQPPVRDHINNLEKFIDRIKKTASTP